MFSLFEGLGFVPSRLLRVTGFVPCAVRYEAFTRLCRVLKEFIRACGYGGPA